MKKLFTLLSAVLIAAAISGQAPEKFSYQAVIRNSGGVLVQSHAVGIKISILQGSSGGSAVYEETHAVSTNTNGLVTLQIGGGSVLSGTFSTIDWSNGPYFLLTETDPTGGTNYTAIVGTSELLSVPYALYAKNAGTADYNSLLNLPVLFDGAYSSLTGKPIIPTTTSQLTNNSGFISSYTETDPVYTGSQAMNITSAHITKLSNLSGVNTGDQDLSSFATITALVSGLSTKVDMVGGKGLSTEDYTSAEKTKLTGIATGAEVNVNADWNAGSGDAQILNKPAFATVATTGSYSDLINKPVIDGSETKLLSGTNVLITGSGTTGSPYTINASGGGSGWGLTGNAGTVDGTNFIGTTDNVPLNFRVNDQVAGKIFPANNDTYFGYQTGLSNTTGNGNTVFGHQALKFNTSGNDNVASGYQALVSNTTGGANSAFGTTALISNTTGNGNTALGSYSDVSTGTLYNATAIGLSAIVNASNTIQLGNAEVTQVIAGTGTNATLIAGGLQITGGSPAEGKVLTSDDFGFATWKVASPLDACANCQATRVECETGAAGDPDAILFCYDQYLVCLGVCEPYAMELGKMEIRSRASFFGYNSGRSSDSFSNVTALGANAIVTTSNAIQLGDAAVTQVFAGTGSSATLIAGGLKITGGTPAAGKVLTSDATGVATWQTAGGGGWGLTGNASTVDGTNFIGTTDNIPFNIKVNNQKSGRIDPTNSTAFFGYQSGLNATGIRNTAIGTGALSNSTGQRNTASGMEALKLNTSGNSNTANGMLALQSNTTGSYNTALGYLADVSSGALTNATAIGNGAMVDASNTIQLGNASVTQVFVGTSTTATLIAGGLQITGGTPAAGKVLTSDATGVATWQAAGGDPNGVLLTGNQTIAGNKTFSGTTTVATPVNATDAATKAYVDVLKQQIQALEDNLIATGTFKVTDIDGNQYNVVKIGTQVWMKENLKTTKYNDGTVIPNITVNATWAALTTGAYSDYGNTPGNSTTYGRLYNWYVVDNNASTKVASNGSKNVCPTGWHVPAVAEFTTLSTYLGGDAVAGGKLKETGTTHWSSPNTGATDVTGFTALPGGRRDLDGTFYYIFNGGFWWATTAINDTNARALLLDAWLNDFGILTPYLKNGYSVRCLRD